jgi:tetratricopeptide (TPR) repeat protein
VLGLVQTRESTFVEEPVSEEGSRPQGKPPPEGGALHERPQQLSALLEELARAPAAQLEQAWGRGLRPGDRVGRFELQRELGRGGFGVVYEAQDLDLGRAVAFKAIRPGARLGDRTEEWLRREAEAVARLNHPNIVTLHDLGSGPTGPYLIFELLRGQTLAARLQGGALPLGEAVRVAVEVARALAHAHAAGVVHRDLKPANVILTDDGAVKVLDFGLAHLFGRDGPPTAGTPAYMAPEQWRAEPGDERTDLFALGVVLHQMICAELPYRILRERSEVLDPGDAPRLSSRSVPVPLRRLVHAMIAKAAIDRPASAQRVLDELLAVQRALSRPPVRRGARAAAAVALTLAVAVSTWRLLSPEAGPGAVRLGVLVPDFVNETGDRDLDGLSGLLSTSLEQSRRLAVVTRAQSFDLLRRQGRGEVDRIDEPLARELGRLTGAQALLLGSVHRLGERYALALTAVDPAADRHLFSLREDAPGKDGLLDALDRLSERARGALRERSAEISGSQVRLAEAITGNVEAYRHYFEGQDCMERPSRSGSWLGTMACAEHFRQALAVEPGFALAHYQLAMVLSRERGPTAERDAHLAAAVRSMDRVPARERTLIRAWKEHADGRDDAALALYQELLERFPDDKQALFRAGDLLYHRGDHAAALPYFERVLALQPGAEWPADHAVQSLALLGRRADLERLVEQLRGLPLTADRLHARVRALVSLGRGAEAVELARGATPEGGRAAAEDLVGTLVATGAYAEAEAELRRAPPADPADLVPRLSLVNAVAAQGRAAEALRLTEAVEVDLPLQRRAQPAYVRAVVLAGQGRRDAAWLEAVRLAAEEPELAADLGVVLALLGEAARAEALVRGVAPGSPQAEQVRALVTWRKGDGPGAMAALAALEVRNPLPPGGAPPAFLLAVVSDDSGDPREAVRAVHRFQQLWPRGAIRALAWPRALLLLARNHARLGEQEQAREAAGRLLALLSRADPGLPLRAAAEAEARKLGLPSRRAGAPR